LDEKDVCQVHLKRDSADKMAPVDLTLASRINTDKTKHLQTRVFLFADKVVTLLIGIREEESHASCDYSSIEGV
jgi:hypothetical protein